MRLNASMQSVTIEAAKKGSESSSSNGKMAQQEKRAGSKVMLKKAKVNRQCSISHLSVIHMYASVYFIVARGVYVIALWKLNRGMV